jgi:hypothetical protein
VSFFGSCIFVVNEILVKFLNNKIYFSSNVGWLVIVVDIIRRIIVSCQPCLRGMKILDFRTCQRFWTIRVSFSWKLEGEKKVVLQK